MIAAIGWPVLHRIHVFGPVAFSPHGLFTAVGFLIGAWLLGRLASAREVAPEHVEGIVLWSIVGAVVGARFFYVIGHLSEFDSLIEVLEVWRGGISLLGGIAGAVLVNVPRVRRWGYRFFQVADPVAVSLSLGIAIGRVGDLIIGDHLGRPTSWALAWTYRGGQLSAPFRCVDRLCTATLQDGTIVRVTNGSARLTDAAGQIVATGVGVHQTALYDMGITLMMFGVLGVLWRRGPREGTITLAFGLIYGVGRLVEDSFRIDQRLFGLTGSQWTAATVGVVCGGLLLWRAARPLEPATETASGDVARAIDEEASAP